MNPLAQLTLILIALPCVTGLLMLRWKRKGYLTETPRWLGNVDSALEAALPESGKPARSTVV